MANTKICDGNETTTTVRDIYSEAKEYIDKRCDRLTELFHRKKWKDRVRYTDKRKNTVRREKYWR